MDSSKYLQILISSANDTSVQLPPPSEWTWSLLAVPKDQLRSSGQGVRQFLLQNGTVDDRQPEDADTTSLVRVNVAELKDENALVLTIREAPAALFASDPLAVDASAIVSNGNLDLSSDDIPAVVFTNPSYMFVQNVYNTITDDENIVDLPNAPSLEHVARLVANFLNRTYGQRNEGREGHKVLLFDLVKKEEVTDA